MKQTAAELASYLLTQERESRGLTWLKLAEELGVNYSTLSRWRRGKALGPAAELLPLTLKHCPCQHAEPEPADIPAV